MAACDAQTLENLQFIERLPSVSERDLWMMRAAVLGAAAGFATATDALNAAVSIGLFKLSERDLLALYASQMCNLGGFP